MKLKTAKIKMRKVASSAKEMERNADTVGKAAEKRLAQFVKGRV